MAARAARAADVEDLIVRLAVLVLSAAAPDTANQVDIAREESQEEDPGAVNQEDVANLEVDAAAVPVAAPLTATMTASTDTMEGITMEDMTPVPTVAVHLATVAREARVEARAESQEDVVNLEEDAVPAAPAPAAHLMVTVTSTDTTVDTIADSTAHPAAVAPVGLESQVAREANQEMVNPGAVNPADVASLMEDAVILAPLATQIVLMQEDMDMAVDTTMASIVLPAAAVPVANLASLVVARVVDDEHRKNRLVTICAQLPT